MEGTIPEALLQNGQLLGTIHFSRNNLNGTIPTEFAALPLTDLRLDENALSGSIPAQLGSISTLRKYIIRLLSRSHITGRTQSDSRLCNRHFGVAVQHAE